MKPLPEKKRKYVKGLVAGKSKRKAALDAGYATTTADNAKHQIETPDVRAEFQRLMRAAIPSQKLVERIREGIDAEETKFFQKDGEVTDQRNVVAWGERRAYVELAAQYGGYFIPKQELEVNDRSDGGSRLAAILASAAKEAERVHESDRKG